MTIRIKFPADADLSKVELDGLGGLNVTCFEMCLEREDESFCDVRLLEDVRIELCQSTPIDVNFYDSVGRKLGRFMFYLKKESSVEYAAKDNTISLSGFPDKKFFPMLSIGYKAGVTHSRHDPRTVTFGVSVCVFDTEEDTSVSEVEAELSKYFQKASVEGFLKCLTQHREKLKNTKAQPQNS